ncbi:MAG: penicillin acylase family protein [Methylocaldum sp.]|nr:penicillin acylase family protein [Methylocaldum sp.]
MNAKRFLYLFGFALLFVIAPAAYQIDRIAQSLPVMDGEAGLPGLSEKAEVEADEFGIPSVRVETREDAFRVLGYLHARDRLFQMDLMRRKTAGRLAEVFGAKALLLDKRQRAYQFQRAAEDAVNRMPADQRKVLQAYTDGVNAFISRAKALPFEFRVLAYHPDAWRLEDSMLVALGMFQTLNGHDKDERTLTLMDRLLPAEVTAFLTPDTDPYVTVLLGGGDSHRPARPVPVKSIASLIEEVGDQKLGSVIEPEAPSIGSNNWAVGGTKTKDGRAIVANDMHLGLSVPNIWYRARLLYGDVDLSGVTLPGVPLVVVGSNRHVVWGFTNVDADLLDLVRVELDPADPGRYRTPEGWRRFETRTETIVVKDGSAEPLELKSTVWGPLAPEPLLGQPVAVRWTALDPRAVNLGLLGMDRVKTLNEAMAVVNRAGAPPQNVVLADDAGHIAWTYMGFFPRRVGFDGSVSVSWANGSARWDGFIPPEELPRVVDPAEGFLATANNRTLGKEYPYVIGHNFSYSYRAYRIAETLKGMPRVSEQDMLALQLDTVSEFYEFYRRLALSVLNGEPEDAILAEAKRSIERWNGRLDADSIGIGLLVEWRRNLAKAVFAPLVSRCAAADPNFAYAWREQETPLRTLLTEQVPETLPDRQYADWRSFLIETLRRSAEEAKQRNGVDRLENLAWGEINRVHLSHPFSQTFTLAGWVLDMPEEPASGCGSFCVRVLFDGHGASERMAVSPNHPEDGILHMPGGQSGHPFSVHYRDQQQAWLKGVALPFLPGAAKHHLTLIPE